MSESGKSCGDCGLCCKLLGIDAIDKAPGKWCGHFRKGVGKDFPQPRATSGNKGAPAGKQTTSCNISLRVTFRILVCHRGLHLN